MIHINRLGEFSSDPESRKPGKATSSAKATAPPPTQLSTPSTKIVQFVSENPLVSLGVGLGLGIVAGYILKRR